MGQFTGDTFRSISFDGITASETEYDYRFIDWHYHDNPYFSLITLGNCREINRRGTFECSPDTVLFHNHHDPHSSIKSDGSVSRHFQLEMSTDWCRKLEIDPDRLPASAHISNTKIKLLFYGIYRETKLFDDSSSLVIDSLLLQAFDAMHGVEKSLASTRPRWVNKIDEILRDNFDGKHSLRELSDQLDLHPGHLSRDFSRYFRCGFSEYIRRIKVEKALTMLRDKKLSLAEIAATCGFADQSHFNRCFKEFVSVTPRAYRKLVNS
jgi:AraC family transcriptional regulator